jgi:hypothetical protein
LAQLSRFHPQYDATKHQKGVTIFRNFGRRLATSRLASAVRSLGPDAAASSPCNAASPAPCQALQTGPSHHGHIMFVAEQSELWPLFSTWWQGAMWNVGWSLCGKHVMATHSNHASMEPSQDWLSPFSCRSPQLLLDVSSMIPKPPPLSCIRAHLKIRPKLVRRWPLAVLDSSTVATPRPI